MSTITLTLRVDTVTPALTALQKPEIRQSILEAGALAIASTAVRAFDEAALRPATWPARKQTYAHPLLKKSGFLWQSIRVGTVTPDRATILAPAPYAAVHQFGSRRKKGRGGGIPARPFFPITPAGDLTPAIAPRVQKAMERALDAAAGPVV